MMIVTWSWTIIMLAGRYLESEEENYQYSWTWSASFYAIQDVDVGILFSKENMLQYYAFVNGETYRGICHATIGL